MLGGDHDFKKAVEKANSLGLKVLVDSLARVSSSRMHRKYRGLLCSTIDGTGKKTFLYGSEGRAVNYEDTVELNYRKKRVWDLMLEELMSLLERFPIDGFMLDSGQSWPPIFRSDDKELYRLDPDGARAYSEQEIAEGEVVVEQEGGYWATPLKSSYANPFLVRLCQRLWQKRPNLLLISECWSSSEGF
jgi:hypothetical protein